MNFSQKNVFQAAKIQERPDISKVRISKVDINSMSFGPPKFGGGMAQWGRGSNNKKMSAQEPPLRQANRFATNYKYFFKLLFERTYRV